MATTANPYTGFDPYNQAPQPDVSIVDLPTDNTPVTVIDNPTAQQEVSIVNPATANQNIQGPAQQAKVQPASPTTTNLPSQQPTIKTNQQDVVNTFQRLLGRAPNMTPGSQDYNNVLEMTKMSPQEVEKSLQATRDSIVGAQAKPASSSKQEAPKQETTVSGEPAVTPGSQEGDWQIFADGSKYNSKTGEVIGKDGVSSLAKAEGEKATETDLMDDWAASVKTEVDSANKELDAFGVTLSESAKRQIEDIKKSFEIRKAQQAIINKALLGGTAVSGMVSGRARYARDIQQSILSAEESAGIARLTALDVEERKLIEEAKTALEEKQFSLLEKKRANLLKVLDAKKEALIESAKMAKEQEELVINKMKAMQDQFNADRTYELETKKYELSERTAADKAALDKAQLDVSIAGLTGKYYDEPTLAAKKQAADEAFRMLGYELDEKEFDEMRANNTFNQKIALRKVELAESQAEAEKMGIDVVDTAQKIMDGTLKYSDVVAKEKAPVTRALNAALSNQREAFTEAYKTTGNAYYSIKSSAGGKQVVSSTEMLLSKMFGSQQSLDVVKSVFDEAAAKGKTGAFKGRITDLKFWDQDKAAIDAALP